MFSQSQFQRAKKRHVKGKVWTGEYFLDMSKVFILCSNPYPSTQYEGLIFNWHSVQIIFKSPAFKLTRRKSMKKTILYFTTLFLMLSSSGCDRLEVENQISAKQQDIASLQARNLQLTNEVNGYAAQVARLNANQPDGMVVEELRKALTLKESNLQSREGQITKKEESLRLAVTKIDQMQRTFYAETGTKLEAIGEARQIKREYDKMSASLDVANDRANNWLIYISVLIIAFVLSVFFVIFTGMKYSRQNKDIDAALYALRVGGIDVQDKQAIASALGRRLDFKDDDNSS